MTLHNLSSKAVNAVEVSSSDEPGTGEREAKGGFSGLIASGSSYQMRMGVPNSGKTVNAMFVEDPKPAYVILQTVLFDDGSYEEDAGSAAEMAAEEFGADLQRLRINRLAEPILRPDGLDKSKIERIRAAIRQLPSVPDPETIAQFHDQYPAFPGLTSRRPSPTSAQQWGAKRS